MQDDIIYAVFEQNEVNKHQIITFLNKVDKDFYPNLSLRVSLEEYSEKLKNYAINFCSYLDNELIGLASVYFNKRPKYSYWTFFAVDSRFRSFGVGIELESMLIDYCKKNDSKGIEGEVRSSNKRLIRIHEMFGFQIVGVKLDTNDLVEKLIIRVIF